MNRHGVLSWVVLLACSSALADTHYEVVDLGGLVSGGDAWVTGLNNAGQVVGWADNGNSRKHGTLFRSQLGGTNLDLTASAPSFYSSAADINNFGVIVGYADVGAVTVEHATLFDATGGGANIDLGLPSGTGWISSEARGISDAGHVVGYSWTSSNSVATLFDPTGGGANLTLGTLPGRTNSRAEAVNSAGQVVGWAFSGYANERAVLFDTSGGGNNLDLGAGGAWDINDAGRIVGQSGSYRATIFDATGGGANVNLGTLGGDWSDARAVSSNGTIVGSANTSNGDTHIALFDATGGGNNVDVSRMIAAASPIRVHPTLIGGVNDNGWIAIDGTDSETGRVVAVLLKPTTGSAPVGLTFTRQATSNAQATAGWWPDNQSDTKTDAATSVTAQASYWEELPPMFPEDPPIMARVDTSASASTDSYNHRFGAVDLELNVSAQVWASQPPPMSGNASAEATNNLDGTLTVGTAAGYAAGTPITLLAEASSERSVWGNATYDWNVKVYRGGLLLGQLDETHLSMEIATLAGESLRVVGYQYASRQFSGNWGDSGGDASGYAGVTFTVTPEPATMGLLALGGAAMLPRLRRRR